MNAALIYTFQPGYRISVRCLSLFVERKRVARKMMDSTTSVTHTANMYVINVDIIPRDWWSVLLWAVIGAEATSGGLERSRPLNDAWSVEDV